MVIHLNTRVNFVGHSIVLSVNQKDCCLLLKVQKGISYYLHQAFVAHQTRMFAIVAVLINYCRIDSAFVVNYQITCSKLPVPHLLLALWVWPQIANSTAAAIEHQCQRASFARAITIVDRIAALKSSTMAVSLIQRD